MLITPHSQWLEIKEGDDEKTIARKKKLIKSAKSKMRFQNMDLAQKSKADNWNNFISGKGKKKKTGFFTGACVCDFVCVHVCLFVCVLLWVKGA